MSFKNHLLPIGGPEQVKSTKEQNLKMEPLGLDDFMSSCLSLGGECCLGSVAIQGDFSKSHGN